MSENRSTAPRGAGDRDEVSKERPEMEGNGEEAESTEPTNAGGLETFRNEKETYIRERPNGSRTSCGGSKRSPINLRQRVKAL